MTGVLIAPSRPDDLREEISFYAGGHPFPNDQSFAAARAGAGFAHFRCKRSEVWLRPSCSF